MASRTPKNHSTSHMRRFRVKYRRRRQAKTNYQKRVKLVAQYKNKYGAAKYRLVVRKTNRDIVCQIFSSDPSADRCLVAAYAHELKRYGVPCGYTNYAAAYCTGLLLARRALVKLGKKSDGAGEANGEFYLDDNSDAFKAFLDTGLARCSTGANVFGALKGAVDGGLHVPHNTRRFPGASFDKMEGGGIQWEYDPEKHRERIFGQHVAVYFKLLQDENTDLCQKQFSKFIESKIAPDDIEEMYKKAHDMIREEPNKPIGEQERGYFKLDRKEPKKDASSYEKVRFNPKKITGKERKLKAIAKLEKLNSGSK